jgi:hypothetical protein
LGELFVVQAITLLPPHSQGALDPFVDRTVRLVLDAVFCGALVLLLPRLALAVVAVLATPILSMLLIYRGYYKQPLSFLVASSNMGEGVRVLDAGVALVGPAQFLLVGVLAFKLWLMWRDPRVWPVRRRAWGTLAVSGYVGLIALLNMGVKPMHKIATWESVGSLGSVYGYLPTWTAEAIYFDERVLVDRALARAAHTSDRLADLEASFPVRDRVVLLQVESLDGSLIDFMIDGEPVTPRLNALAKRARYYAVRAPKGTGSSDADFTALMGRLPSEDVPTYKLAGYPYAGSFVEGARGAGYHTSAVHGVSGEFFNRRAAFEKMGFDQIVFREELEESTRSSGWSVRDGPVLEYAAAAFRDREGPALQIVITATSHIPFHRMDERWKVFFPGSTSTEEKYFDVMHYVDTQVGRFLDALPPETTVVVYGDHISQVESLPHGYAQTTRDGVGVVPFLVHDTSLDLAASQRTSRQGVAGDGSLTLLDAVRFVHGVVLSGDRAPGGDLRDRDWSAAYQ